MFRNSMKMMLLPGVLTKKVLVTVACLFCLVPSVSMAISIDYALSALGGSTYRYDYTVNNTGSLGAGVNVKLFDIAFDTTLYDEASLTIVSSGSLSSDWSEMFLGSTIGVPAQYDVLALADGVSTSTTGFAVQFNWIGGGAGPGNQAFAIYDADSWELLEEGMTSLLVDPHNPVPEPGTMLLTVIGLAGLGLARRRMSK